MSDINAVTFNLQIIINKQQTFKTLYYIYTHDYKNKKNKKTPFLI